MGWYDSKILVQLDQLTNEEEQQTKKKKKKNTKKLLMQFEFLLRLLDFVKRNRGERSIGLNQIEWKISS